MCETPSSRSPEVSHLPVFLCAYARAWDLEQAVWAVVAADFDRDTTIAADRVALFAEKELVEGMERVGGGRCIWGRRDWIGGKTRAVVGYTWCHGTAERVHGAFVRVSV